MGGWLAASFSEKAPHRGVKPSLYYVSDPLPLEQRDVGGWRAADDVGFAVLRQKTSFHGSVAGLHSLACTPGGSRRRRQ